MYQTLDQPLKIQLQESECLTTFSDVMQIEYFTRKRSLDEALSGLAQKGRPELYLPQNLPGLPLMPTAPACLQVENRGRRAVGTSQLRFILST